ncbi:tRNA (guanosine(46)-N7)-methyltransferase TrmB [Pelagibius sp. CAU 1746]|uniref:tRNA (guanosine(46)-N7)-methyltransferase TrmB n=1 Tax=Pelagibius sp. CAU 1746 TaxID=3140370 RepID=UPI00325AFF3F
MAARRNIYGRRQGRPLRAGRKALLEAALPRLEIALPADGRPLSPGMLFDPLPERLFLEIGFGGGEHLAWQAAHNPGTAFIGAEYFVTGVATLLGQLQEQGTEVPLRLYIGDARDLMERLPDAVLDRVFILFPDPWPKARHHKRRLIQRETLDLLARLLKDGGELRFATDDPGYLSWALQRLSDHPAFAWQVAGPDDWRRRPDDWPPTRYEAKALKAGRRPAYLRLLRRPRSGAAE